ncbi:pyruvate kinase [candidate division KSB1 bacterium]
MNSEAHLRRAKIVCTLGISSNTYAKIKALAESGMDVARLNFSHGTYEEHRELIHMVRRVSEDIGKPIAILQDLPGPKIRVQTFKKGAVELKEGDMFTVTTRTVTGNENIVSVSYKGFSGDVTPGETVLLDDGNLKLTVEEIEGPDVHCRVVYGGILKDHKGLNLPGSVLSVDALTEKDKEYLRFGIEHNVDYVAVSFVQKSGDIIMAKKEIESAGRDIPVIAKIEKPQAVDCIDEITDYADVIMIARGDLGVEMFTEEIPPIQKKIIKLCNEKGVPVITATQMLESMIHQARPTRAEAADVANAVLDGTDAVMLSAETAAGAFPVESVKMMSRIVSLIESETEMQYQLLRRKQDWIYPAQVAIGYSACHAAQMTGSAAIICLTQSGSTARMISRFRPDHTILAVTPREDTYHRLSLVWGVSTHKVEHEFPDNMDDALHHIFIMLKDRGFIRTGDKVVITAGIPFQKMRGSNMLRIEEVVV